MASKNDLMKKEVRSLIALEEIKGSKIKGSNLVI